MYSAASLLAGGLSNRVRVVLDDFSSTLPHDYDFSCSSRFHKITSEMVLAMVDVLVLPSMTYFGPPSPQWFGATLGPGTALTIPRPPIGLLSAPPVRHAPGGAQLVLKGYFLFSK